VTREDYGKYTCHATSIKGSAEKTIEISGEKVHRHIATGEKVHRHR
jgi:hypothetical protein